MTCPSCAHANPAGAKFCEECGAAQARACANCGVELRPAVKFCSECGARVDASGADRSSAAHGSPQRQAAAPATPPTGTRKIVTIVFADLVGSTALHERLDAESAQRFMQSYYDAMRAAVESYGGSVTQFLGDGVKAVFGIPRVAEDDAIRAVRAAVEMQRAFHELADQQRGAVGSTGLRVAVNSGEVVANADAEIIGDPVNVAARLQERGGDGDVVVGDSTARLVAALVTLEPLGSFALKGRAETVTAFRVESLERPASAATAFVGRDAELSRITAVYETAVAKPTTALAVLLGSPGLGKSRLIEEFVRRLDATASVIAAHCDEASSATFAPLSDALRERLGIETDVSDEARRAAILGAIPGGAVERTRIADGIAALLAGSPAPPEETFFVVRRLFAALASVRPVVLVIDDLQWGEPLLLDLVEHLVQWGSDVPLLVLVGARPELRDKRAALAIPGGLVAEVVTLAGLDAGAAMRLAANVIGAADLPAAVAAKVLASSEGNPLFVGELVRMLVHEGALKRENDRWTTGTALAALEMPPTIHALLAARIERLHADERVVLERAAVVGRHFSRSAVAALLPGDVEDLDSRFESLLRSELIERETGWWFGEPSLRFHHLLIRDAAYRQLLKGTRAELHTRFADWAVARAGDSVEHDETIGWHLEQSHQFLRELGPLDAHGRTIGVRASGHLATAGRRALARDDVPLAASLLGRAIERLDADAPARAELALDWCEALLAAGDVVAAERAIAELDRLVGDSERLRAWHTCFAGQHSVLTAPEDLQATADNVAAAARSLASLDDAAGEANAHFVNALALSRLGRIGACEAALDRALAAARRVDGDRRRANTVLAVAPLAALWGPSPVTRASGRCLDVVRVLRITQGSPAVEAVALSCQGVLEALRGRTDAARRMIASAREMVEELGITQRLLEVDVFGGLVDLLEGDLAAAERTLRSAYDGLRELGLGIDAAQAAALLGQALLAQHRGAEAEALSHESEALAGDDLKAAIAWRGVRAEALARRGEHAAAVELANQAVEIAAATDALLDHADARLALAAALRAAGREAEADAEERRARELWNAKGATRLAERAGSEVSRGAAAAEEPSAAASALRPRVRPNGATTVASRVEAAITARDVDAFRALFSEDHQEIHRPTGSSHGLDDSAASVERLMRSRDPHFDHRPLATLGEFLALSLRRSGASGAVSRSYDVGAYENHVLAILEVDASGLQRRTEVFAANHLDDAIARLYDRHAELLPEGADRERAVATARSMAAMFAVRPDPDRMATALAPDFECVDLRLLSTWSALGADAFLEHVRSLQTLADDIGIHTNGVLALDPNALLFRVMHSGTQRSGGGAYERPFISLLVCDTSGRAARLEYFDADREAEALARFDDLVAGRERTGQPARRVRPNRATAYCERLAAALSARDAEAIGNDLADDFEYIHHLTGTSYGARGFVAHWRSAFNAELFERRFEIFGSLGETLSVGREWTRVSGLKEKSVAMFGPAEIYDIFVIEDDGQGLCRRVEIFAPERLGNAISHLYERLAQRLEAGEEQTRAAATARSLAAVLTTADLEAWNSAWSLDFELVDHRVLGVGSLQGADAMREYCRAMFELEDVGGVEVDDVLRLEPNAILFRTTTRGIARSGGGDYERPLLQLWVFGRDGLISRMHQFDAEHEAAALAHFETVVASASPLPETFANPASRAYGRLIDCFNAHDWAGVEACAAPALAFDDRRRMQRIAVGRKDWLAMFRVLFDVPGGRFSQTLLATRGERLSLERFRFAGAVAGGGGPLDAGEHLGIHQVDRDGCIVGIVLFDIEDEDAAYAELDARYFAGEAAAHPRALAAFVAGSHALEARDWEAFTANLVPDFDFRDHRLLGWGTVHGSAAFTRTQRELVELAPDTRWRHHHVAITERGILVSTVAFGTRDGGPFELAFVRVNAIDVMGKLCSGDVYDTGDHARARARLAEVSAGTTAAQTFANAATRLSDRAALAWIEKDWERLAPMFRADFHLSERRRGIRLELDRDDTIEFARSLGEAAATHIESEMVATRGERLALTRGRIDVSGGDVGPSRIEYLSLIETDERGAWAAQVRWDADDLDAAYAELDARYDAGEGADPAHLEQLRAFEQAIGSGNWAQMLALCSPTLVEYDHQRLATRGTTHGAEAWVKALRTLTELAPDTRYRIDHVRSVAGGYLSVGSWEGTRDGGRYEIPAVAVLELDERGLLARVDLYDDDGLEAALARLAELDARPGPIAVPDAKPGARRIVEPNAAAAAWDRWLVAFDVGLATGDWDPMRRLCVPEFAFEDRRRNTLLAGDLEMMVASAGVRAESGARPLFERVGDAGERVGITKVLWSGGPPGGRFEIEYFAVSEVDDAGLFRAFVLVDLDDPRAAQREAWARWVAIEPWVASILTPTGEAIDAFNEKDRARYRAVFADDLVVEDRRTAGIGRVDGADAYIDSVVALWEIAGDQQLQQGWLWPAFDRHGALTVGRRTGTVRDGGAFESEYLALCLFARGRMTRIELFEIDALDEALARFAQLAAPDTATRAIGGAAAEFASPNAASAVLDRWFAAFDAGAVGDDWQAMRSLLAPDLRFEDNQRRSLLSGDRELVIASLRERSAAGAAPSMDRVETIGDRIVVHRMLWSGGPAQGPFEIETVNLLEVDASGRLTTILLFDPDDHRAARREAWTRWAAIDPGAAPFVGLLLELSDAWNGRDRAAVRARFADDVVVVDHRHAGLGRIVGADAYVESNVVLWELAPDQRIEFGGAWPALGHHAALVPLRREGTLADGGAFENDYLWLCCAEGGRITRLELFEPEDLHAARARFDELKSDPLRVPANAATRTLARVHALRLANDIDALRAIATDDFCFDDRQRRSLVLGGVEEWLRALRFLWTEARGQLDTQRIATAGDRLVLDRAHWRESPGEGSFVMESLRLVEVDDAGKLRALVLFDPEDRAAAHAELFERYVATRPEGMPRGMIDMVIGMNEHDLERVRRGLHDDFVVDDHRHASMGRLEGADVYMPAAAALHSLVRDWRSEILYSPAIAANARVNVARACGTNSEGGEVESLHVALIAYRGEKLARMEFFEIDQLDAALARFAEVTTNEAPADEVT